MESVRFTNPQKTQLAAALRKNVSDHFRETNTSTKGNLKMYIKAVVMLLIYLLPFWLITSGSVNAWLVPPLAIIMGIGMAGIGMSVMHDAVHCSFSRKSRINQLFGNSIYIIGGNKFNWKVQHNVLHHTYTNISGLDEDIEPKGVFRFTEKSPLKKIHRFQHIYAFFFYSLMTIARLFNEFRQLNSYNKRGITQQQGSTNQKELALLILFKVLYLAVFLVMPLILVNYSWQLIVVAFLLTHFTAGLFMSLVFQMAHVVEEAAQPQRNEQGDISTEWVIHELETTVNFSKGSGLLSYVIGGLDYQIEHHLFPNICHVHYPAISPIVRSTVQSFGVNYLENRNFISAIGSHYRLLKRLGRTA